MHTVYVEGSHHWFWITVLGVVGATCLVGGRRSVSRWKTGLPVSVPEAERAWHKAPASWIILVGCATLMIATKLFLSHQDLLALPRESVEGCVTVVSQQRADGHSHGDVIIVGGKEFVIDSWAIQRGYGTSIAHGGVLRAGTAVRLDYDQDVILRIDILDTRCP